MSDLGRAVAERTADFRPDLVPPFAIVRERKRRRDRVRAGAAVALSALAVAGAALLPSAWPPTGGGGYAGGDGGSISFRQEEPAYAPPSPVPHAAGYSLSYALEHAYDPARDGAALEECASLPGVRERYAPTDASPPVTDLEVHGQDEVLAVDACVHALPGVEVVGFEVLCDDPELCPVPEPQEPTLEEMAAMNPPYEPEVIALADVAARDSTTGLLVRTTYGDDAAWERLLDRLTELDDMGMRAFLTVVEDPALDGATREQAAALVPEGPYRGLLLVADETSLGHPDAAVWAVDLAEQPDAPPFRISAPQLNGLVVNLNIHNMDFRDFADSADPDGVFRGFPS